MLDMEHGRPSDLEVMSEFDDNQYEFGQIGGHNVVLAVLPAGGYGVAQAALAANMMKRAFPAIQFALLVGIGGGVPSKTHDIRLGDVVVSTPGAGHPGVLQYDLGKRGLDDDFTTTGVLRKPARKALAAINVMRARYMRRNGGLADAINEILEKNPIMCDEFSHPGMVNDVLYRAEYDHVPGDDCANCSKHMVISRKARRTSEPRIHYGLIGSGNQVIKNGKFREVLREKHNVLCFEMEAAGALEAFECLVIRGVCDYSDSHKNDLWQNYAALTAAAYTRDLLLLIEGSGSPNAPAVPSPPEVDIPENINLGIPAVPAHGDNPGPKANPPNFSVQNPQFYQQPWICEPPPKYTQATHQCRVAPVPVELPPQQPKEVDGEKKPADRNTSPKSPSSRPSQQPIDPHARKDYGRRLVEAAKAGNMPTVKVFLERGGDPNTTTENWDLTALHYAARMGHNGLTRLLLKAGANPNAKARFSNNTPLFEAASSGHIKVIQYLLRYEADIGVHCQRSKTALHAAAEKGHAACVELLLQNKADPDSIDEDGHTPLDLARKEGRSEIVKYLQRI
ncbi:hypothetical protein AbraIFM66951_000578 [Aspergillus brasiliensis]|uniref:Nucleoside phosphorylase domain-containing protein n=1 Tax=Aspergillus brasiliensis TaxID=319629 RepID=A0A9W6DQI3_9EURO|nr:hypothetical protein AbraCBS73388_000692 [Aspergillus brasiliensis]GKZ48508.1 hypothetical protein AbraIFM66951_000578 [Aspergillus brasiliensis]